MPKTYPELDAWAADVASRHPSEPLLARIVGYLDASNNADPSQVRARVEVLRTNDGLGFKVGARVLVSMEERPAEPNRIVHDLRYGTAQFGVPPCPPESVVEFVAVSARPGEPIVDAGAYRVVDRPLVEGARVSLRSGEALIEDRGAGTSAHSNLDAVAGRLARLTWEGGSYELDDSCLDPEANGAPWFSPEGLEQARRELAAQFRDGAGWRVHASGGEYTFWERKGAFQATRGSTPRGEGGYNRLEAIVSIKSVAMRDLVPATGDAADVRAVPGPDHDNRETWRGVYLDDEAGWTTAASNAGPIAYATPDAARIGGALAKAEAAERRAEAAPRP